MKKECHPLYTIGANIPTLPVFKTAEDIIKYKTQYPFSGFNFWKLPDRELRKLARYLKKRSCKDSYKKFGQYQTLREEKYEAIKLLLKNPPKCKCNVCECDNKLDNWKALMNDVCNQCNDNKHAKEFIITKTFKVQARDKLTAIEKANNSKFIEEVSIKV